MARSQSQIEDAQRKLEQAFADLRSRCGQVQSSLVVRKLDKNSTKRVFQFSVSVERMRIDGHDKPFVSLRCETAEDRCSAAPQRFSIYNGADEGKKLTENMPLLVSFTHVIARSVFEELIDAVGDPMTLSSNANRAEVGHSLQIMLAAIGVLVAPPEWDPANPDCIGDNVDEPN